MFFRARFRHLGKTRLWGARQRPFDTASGLPLQRSGVLIADQFNGLLAKHNG